MVEKRRRSSWYRPSDLYPLRKGAVAQGGSHIRENKNITDLPVPVLGQVCSSLHTGDLLQVCLASRMLYLPAAVQLYKKIIVTESHELRKLAMSQSSSAWVNYGTLVHTSKLVLLLRTVCESTKLADLVRSVIFVDETKTETEAGQRRWVQTLQAMLARVRLNELWCLLDGSRMALALHAPSLSRLALSVETFEPSAGREPSFFDFPRLAHLKIYYQRESARSAAGTVELARLLSADSTRTLTTVEFEEMHQSSLESLNRANAMNREHSHTVWPQFFEVLRHSGTKLALSRLGLDGFIGDRGAHLAQLLSTTVDLAQLVSLQLNVKETSHLHQSHDDYSCTLLENLTALTPRLRKLATHPTFDCLFCQHSSLLHTLSRNVPHQLSTLFAVVESPTSAYTQAVYDCIGSTQNRLVNLKLLDRSSQAADASVMLQHLMSDDYSWYIRALYYESVLRQSVYKNYFLYDIECISSVIGSQAYNHDVFSVRTNSVMLNDTMVQFVRKNHLRLARFLVAYFAVEPHCVSPRPVLQLPQLQYLSILGLSIFFTQTNGRRAQFMLNYGDQYIDLHGLA
ncbi:hypothetical protein JA9_003590 [Meyerozyma sp. JA9]|nr:hypothetical protein JA9_003590 [Meyerozyma sp. JA9]